MTAVDIAVALLRVVVGLTLVAHGYNHLWGRGGLAGTARWFGSLGLRPPALHAALSGAGELAAGSALAIADRSRVGGWTRCGCWVWPVSTAQPIRR